MEIIHKGGTNGEKQILYYICKDEWQNLKKEKVMNKPTSVRPVYLAILLILVTLLIAESALAQNSTATSTNGLSASPQQQGGGPTDPAELEAFLDELMAEQMKEYHIAGAAVSVVKDGELFFAKGYGYADLENSTPVDPAQTVFRLGSSTKPFTWTAVMQLVEQGKLNLEADVNTYLDFEIPGTYPEPIKLKHLMTHTSGFEYVVYEFLTYDADELIPAGEWLASHIPGRVRPPGFVTGYSNYNADLAGYIVARVSGMPYDQYIQENILDPLEMFSSVIHSPPPPDLWQSMSKAYWYRDGAYQEDPLYMGQPGIMPGAGLSAPVTDIAHFMIAHLQSGRYGDIRILEENTTEQMHREILFNNDPRVSGMLHGFYDLTDSGQYTIGHSGGGDPMYSTLLLLPDQNLGVFAAWNSDGGTHLNVYKLGFQRAFFDHYYPAPEVGLIEPPADFAERVGRFTGNYRYTSSAYTTPEKLIQFMLPMTISDPGDGTLLFTNPWGEFRYVEVEPLYFRQVDGELTLVFLEDDRGRITHMFWSIYPAGTFEKLSWYETSGFNMALALTCVLIFMSVLVVVLIRFIRNRRRSDERELTPRGARVARWIVVGITSLHMLFLVGTVLWGMEAMMPLFGVSPIYTIVLVLPVLAAVLTVGALIYTVLAWKDSYWGIGGRVYYTLVTVAAVGFVWFLNFWNLLGWRL
jgi:CubicO group peptidase (beta-lactamase class C family)